MTVTSPQPTRERIIAAALELFAEQGFEATSTAQIEEAVGLSPRSGALYKHFGSKQELLEVALGQRMQEIDSLPDRLDLGPVGDLRAELTLVAQWGLAELDRQRTLARIVMKEGHRVPGLADSFRDAIVRPGLRLSVEVVRRWSDSTGVALADPEAVAEVMCAALVGFSLQQTMFGEGFVDVDPQRFTAAFVDIAVATIENDRRNIR